MLNSILTLIVDTVAAVLGGVLLLRFWMQVVRVRPPAALGQFTFQLTDWLVRPLRRVLPGERRRRQSSPGRRRRTRNRVPRPDRRQRGARRQSPLRRRSPDQRAARQRRICQP